MSYTNDPAHDALVQRLQAIQPFVIQSIDITGTPQPWQRVDGDALMRTLVISPHSLRHQVDTAAAEIGHWGRMVAQCRRVWQVHERRYRHWRSTIELECLRSGIPGLEKSATKAAIESYYRTLPAYDAFQTAIEEAEEALNSAQAVFEAFKEKGAQLRRDTRIGSDGSTTRYTA